MSTENEFEGLSAEELGELLTRRQRLFIAELDKDNNGTRAAVRAGFAPGKNNGSAAVSASRMLKDPKIAAYRRARAREMYEAAGIDESAVVLRLEDIYNRCMQREPVMEWDSVRHAWVPSGEWKFDAKNAIKALELLGVNIGMFAKNLNVDAKGSIEEYLKKLGEQEM